MGERRDIECRACDGKGWIGPVHVNRGDDPHEWIERMDCRDCDGTGQWTPQRLAAWERGRQMRAARIARRETIAAMADRLGISAAEMSCLERGREPTTDAGRRALQQQGDET